MYPSSLPGNRNNRVKVDSELGSFYAGTQFRTFKEITLGVGASVNIKMVRPIDIIIRGFTMHVNSGNLRCEIYRNATLGGVWNSPLPVIGKCEFSDNPLPIYTPQCALTSGGSFTGGILYDLMDVKTANATGQASTIGDSMESQLGAPAGSTGIYKFMNTGLGDASGIFTMWWEELPVK